MVPPSRAMQEIPHHHFPLKPQERLIIVFCICILHSKHRSRTASMYDTLQHVSWRWVSKNNKSISNQEKTNEKTNKRATRGWGNPPQTLVGETGSGLIDLRTGRSKTGSGDSAAALNALIFCVINALCLLFGVVGCDRDLDLVRVTVVPSNCPAISSSDCDSLDWMDGKPSNTGETRERGELEFRPSGRYGDVTRLRNGDTLGVEGKGDTSEGSWCLATIVNPRGRLPGVLAFLGTSGTVGNCGITSS